MTATEIHPRNGDDGTIGSAMPANDFVDEYLRDRHDTTLDDAVSGGILSRLLG